MSEVSTTASTSTPTTTSMTNRSNGSKPSIRSPFVGFNEVFNSFTVHEKGLKTGFYNSIALIFLLVVIIIIYYCYWILRPFLQPLIWATLCGSALHPFKRRFLVCSDKWIKDLKSDCKPITLSTIFLPFSIINQSVDSLFTFVAKNKKTLLSVIAFIVFHHFFVDSLQTIIDFVFNSFFNVLKVLFGLLSHLTDSDNTLIIITVTIGYLTVLSLGWSDSTHRYITYLSPFVWFSLLINIICLTGTLGLILFSTLVSITLIGLIKTLISGQSHSSNDQIDGLISTYIKVKNIFTSSLAFITTLLKTKDNESNGEGNEVNSEECEQSSGDQKQYASVATSPMPVINATNHSISRRTSLVSNTQNKRCYGNIYLCAVLWAVVLVQFWLHPKSVYLIAIPVIWKVLALAWTYLSNKLQNINGFNDLIHNRNNALFHPLFQKTFNYFLIGDKVIRDTIESSLNGLTSLAIICLTIVSILFIGVFMSIQIYGESLQLVNLMSNVFNKTLNYYPESSLFIPESFKGVDGVLDHMVRNGYEYGRLYIKDSIKNVFNVDSNSNQSNAVEKQILEIWDRAYHLWLIRGANESELIQKKGPYDFHKLSNALKTLDLTFCVNFVKENIDTFVSVLDSVWLLLKGNVTLLFTATAAVLSTLLGGGLGLMNLVFSFIIFTTALFYLLSASGEYYKPVELVNQIFPSEVRQQKDSNSDNKFGRAVEEAINGVFAASIKLSVFYGLYTWLIHTLFDVNICFIPSVMAAILSAVPFLSAFWATFPAFLQLFFVQQLRTKAILLLITAYFPSFFVDSTIYGEIQSAGHPYLTGLAIAGGIFYLGIEGALFGPILLCCLFVAFNMYSDIMSESAVNPIAPTLERTPHTTHRHTNKLLQRNQSIF